jgi:hypothetical protein
MEVRAKYKPPSFDDYCTKKMRRNPLGALRDKNCRGSGRYIPERSCITNYR